MAWDIEDIQVESVEEIFGDIYYGIGRTCRRGRSQGPHGHGCDIDSYPDEPLVGIGQAHENLPDDVQGED